MSTQQYVEKPEFEYRKLDSGAHLVRFDNLRDIYYWDERENNPNGISIREVTEQYKIERQIINEEKSKILRNAQKNLSGDKGFLELIHKAKSLKRKNELNKFGGNLNIVQYAVGSDKMFNKTVPGAKKSTLNLAFQVGTFIGSNYQESFEKIIKTILTCQAMGIMCNIDMFDSDTRAINNEASYVICNVSKSHEKLNYRNILAASHREFFRVSLFNGYSASGQQYKIGTFLPERRIVKDLGKFYDVIGGNILLNEEEQQGEKGDLVSKILKIGLR